MGLEENYMSYISSHDYDAVNWSIAKRNCQKILQSITSELLDTCMADIFKKKQDIKDYTQ